MNIETELVKKKEFSTSINSGIHLRPDRSPHQKAACGRQL